MFMLLRFNLKRELLAFIKLQVENEKSKQECQQDLNRLKDLNRLLEQKEQQLFQS